jgi:hypothetical protein
MVLEPLPSTVAPIESSVMHQVKAHPAGVASALYMARGRDPRPAHVGGAQLMDHRVNVGEDCRALTTAS